LLPLADLNVLELGAGTGVLASLLGPVCARFIATDRPENMRLVEKNIDANKHAIKGSSTFAAVAAVDWVDITAARNRAATKNQVYAVPEGRGIDVVLAVDCIYNEHLVAPLVDALAAACAHGAVAWVVVELRSADVVRINTAGSGPDGGVMLTRI
jgi:predicted nicotinamide N-methyase